MRDCTMAVTGAVTVSGAVSPKLSRLASRASHPRGAPLADLHAVRRAFASGVAGHTARLPRAG